MNVSCGWSIVSLDLDTGRRGTVARGLGKYEAIGYLESLADERRRARDPRTGRYPAIIHGIKAPGAIKRPVHGQ